MNDPKIINVSPEQLPAFCPPANQALWDKHPRVYIKLSDTNKRQACPYCGAVFILKSSQGS